MRKEQNKLYLSLQPVQLSSGFKADLPKGGKLMFIAYTNKKDALYASNGDMLKVVKLIQETTNK